MIVGVGFANWIVFVLRELITFSSYLSRKDQSYFYARRWRKYLPPLIRSITRYNFFKKIVGSKIFFLILKTIEKSIPTPIIIEERIAVI